MNILFRIMSANVLLAIAFAAPAAHAQARSQSQRRPGEEVSRTTLSRTNRLFGAKRYREAREGLERILRTEKYRDDPEFHFQYGVCLYSETPPRTERARKEFETAVELDQEFSAAYFWLARTFASADSRDRDIPRAKGYLLEAARTGYNVLGKLDGIPEFGGNASIVSPGFIRDLLWVHRADEPIFADSQDPFHIPRDLVLLEDDERREHWLRQQQRNFVQKLERDWKTASLLLHSSVREESDAGLDLYTEIAERIQTYRPKINQPEFRLALERVEESMGELLPWVKTTLIERFVGKGDEILASMRASLGARDFDAVLLKHSKLLLPLTDLMIHVDEDFTDASNVIRSKGEEFQERALVMSEIESLRLEVRGIVIEEPRSGEQDPDKRIAIIWNGSETAEMDPPLAGWVPRQRKYGIGSTIYQIAELTVTQINRSKVICLYKDRYEVDLPLKQRGEER
ncbi:MAG: hypothetical protein O7H41_09265 [Planctomycetota bacterium]|nr:hypothetical protein [Planctomycetota bacterium]